MRTCTSSAALAGTTIKRHFLQIVQQQSATDCSSLPRPRSKRRVNDVTAVAVAACRTTLMKSWVPGRDGPAAALNTEGLCDELNVSSSSSRQQTAAAAAAMLLAAAC
jgi:hypothetical protein